VAKVIIYGEPSLKDAKLVESAVEKFSQLKKE